MHLFLPCRAQQALLVGAVQSLERHLAGLFAAWSCAALSSFATKLSGAVECSLRCAEQNCEPLQCGGLPQPDVHARAAELADAAASPCVPPSGKDTPQPEAVTGRSAAGEPAEKSVTHPELAPSTPAGRDVRPAHPAAVTCATPAATTTALAQPFTGQELKGAAQVQGAQQAAGAEAAVHEQLDMSRDALATVDGLSSWAASHPPGDPAAALVLASAAFTAACDMGLASGAGSVPWPHYLISTRESFTHHLSARATQVIRLLSTVRLSSAAEFTPHIGRTRTYSQCTAGDADGAPMHQNGVLFQGQPGPQQLC